MSEKQGERAELQKELERYRECDPEVIDAMKEETKVAKEAANRWTGKIRPNKKIPVLRVTRPYLNLLVKPRIFFRFSGKKKKLYAF